MAFHPSTAGGGSRRRTDVAGPSQNAVACESPATRHLDAASSSSPSDSKRNNAAQLARELGSSSPWSEAFMPQTHSSMSSHPASRGVHSAARQELGHINPSTAQRERDLDPPPAYSRSPPPNSLPSVHELPAQTMDIERATASAAPDRTEAQDLHTTDIEQSRYMQGDQPDVETPLLGRRHSRRRGGKCWQWIQRAKARRRKYSRLICAVIFFSIVASVLVCILTDDDGNGFSFINRPLKSGQSIVPTGPDYRRHETTEDIRGAYKLYDRIELTTTTGIIDIEIEPEEGDGPAVLILSSDFGSITVRISADYFKRRDRVLRAVHTEIRSLTGSVTAEILLGHGGYTLVDTTTGVQTLSVMTYGVGRYDEQSNLTTLSKTGTQYIVLTSLEKPDVPIWNLRAEHHALGTASLDVTYPSAWLGEIHAVASPFGHVSVSGGGLKYTRRDRDSIIAYRGPSQVAREDLNLVEVVSEGTGSASFKC